MSGHFAARLGPALATLGVLLAPTGPATGPARAGDLSMALLPDGAISVARMAGVQAEICRDHLFDPARAPAPLPAGHRLRRADDVATRDPALADWLRRHPAAAGMAVGSLCVLSVTGFTVDGVPVADGPPLALAFWWAAAEGPADPVAARAPRWVQLGSWYPAGTGHSPALLRTDPMAQFVDLAVTPTGPDTWRLRLTLPGETVTAEVQVGVPDAPTRSDAPARMVVPMSGPAADRFSVYVYAGHRHRPARGVWRTDGRGVFTDAFALPDEAAAFSTVVQDGWTAVSGLYRFATPAR
jgi:hypothetical protein